MKDQAHCWEIAIVWNWLMRRRYPPYIFKIPTCETLDNLPEILTDIKSCLWILTRHHNLLILTPHCTSGIRTSGLAARALQSEEEYTLQKIQKMLASNVATHPTLLTVPSQGKFGRHEVGQARRQHHLQ